jgi:GTP-binding protein Era
MTVPVHRAGNAAIVGRPNVGKSTLLNALVGAKVAAVTPKPQTTRNRITGICTRPDAQVVFLDTPGMHSARSPLNRRMVDTARRTLDEADVLVLVVDATAGVGPGERTLVETLVASRKPIVVALNKIDQVARPALLPIMAALGQLLPDAEVIPSSARRGEGVALLLERVAAVLPEGPALYPEDEYTAEPARFLAQEIVHEQVFLATAEEVPYGSAVIIDQFQEHPPGMPGLLRIHATVLVSRESHKAIVIGAGGARLKDIGTKARLALEESLGTKVFLELFVRVEPTWSRNPRRLGELGL